MARGASEVAGEATGEVSLPEEDQDTPPTHPIVVVTAISPTVTKLSTVSNPSPVRGSRRS